MPKSIITQSLSRENACAVRDALNAIPEMKALGPHIVDVGDKASSAWVHLRVKKGTSHDDMQAIKDRAWEIAKGVLENKNEFLKNGVPKEIIGVEVLQTPWKGRDGSKGQTR